MGKVDVFEEEDAEWVVDPEPMSNNWYNPDYYETETPTGEKWIVDDVIITPVEQSELRKTEYLQYNRWCKRSGDKMDKKLKKNWKKAAKKEGWE